MNPATSITTRRNPLRSLVLGGAIAIVGAQIALTAQFTPRTSATEPAYLRTNPEEVAKRIHRALFERDSDGSTTDTAREVVAGRTRARLDALIATPEFRTLRNRNTPAQMLNQISQGLLSRAPTAAESKQFATHLKTGRHAEIVMTYLGQDEFRRSLPAPGPAPAPAPSGVNPTVDTARAADCQEQVVEQMRDNTQGIVFLRFEGIEADGSGLRGVAFDVIDGNRRLTYRCGGGPSYTYDDGRNSRSAPNEGDFPSERVRACHNAVRSRVLAQRSGIEVNFESAGLMSSGDQVRGLGHERKPQGQNFHYRCQLSGTTVTNATFNWR